MAPFDSAHAPICTGASARLDAAECASWQSLKDSLGLGDTLISQTDPCRSAAATCSADGKHIVGLNLGARSAVAPNRPTAQPAIQTSPVEFTTKTLKRAVHMLCNPATRQAALDRYGLIDSWDVSKVTEMAGLFRDCTDALQTGPPAVWPTRAPYHIQFFH